MNNDNFGLHLESLEKCLGLQLTHEVLVEKVHTYEKFWSKNWRHSFLGNIMACDKYQKAMKHLTLMYNLVRVKAEKLTNFV